MGSVAEIVGRLRTFPYRPLPLPVNAAFTRQFGLDTSVLLFGNARRYSSPQRYPAPFRDVVLEGHDGVPIAASVAMQSHAAPMLFICHGLCMTRRFRAVITLARHAFEHWGWHVVAWDARGCGASAWLGDEQPTAGWLEGEDLVAIARQVKEDGRVSAVHALGISLGASAVLNGARVESRERAEGAAPAIDSVLAISGPTMLGAAVDHISTRPHPRHPFFVLWAMFKLALVINARRMGERRGSATWRYAVDEWLAPRSGLTPDEFQARASAATFADQIAIPALALHAQDDFCVPVEQARALEEAAADNPNVHVWVLPRGNHAAFDAVTRRWYRSVIRRWCEYWTHDAAERSSVEQQEHVLA
jgi:predicted alpha/beta-fold hydrolase